jgi:CheY-like chemotaxis protein
MPKILVVDDEEAIAKIIEQALALSRLSRWPGGLILI